MKFDEVIREMENITKGEYHTIKYEYKKASSEKSGEISCVLSVVLGKGTPKRNECICATGKNWSDTFIQLQSLLFLEGYTSGPEEGEAPDDNS